MIMVKERAIRSGFELYECWRSLSVTETGSILNINASSVTTACTEDIVSINLSFILW